MQRLRRIGDTGICTDSPADGFDICRARAGLGPAKFLDDLRMLALRLCNVLRIEIDLPLRCGRCDATAAAVSNRIDRRISPNPLSRLLPSK